MHYCFKSISILVISLFSSFLSYSHANALVTVHDFLGDGVYNGNFTWTSQEDQKDTVLCTGTKCYVTICLIGRGDHGYGGCHIFSNNAPMVQVGTGATTEDMRKAFTAAHGIASSFVLRSSDSINNGTSCIGLVYRVGEFFTPKLIPGSNCIAKFNPQECEVGVMENIQYGTLQASQLSGARASGSINILCTLSSDVRLSLSEIEVTLGNPNLVAKLYANGINLSNGKTLQITRNENTKILIESVLQKKGPLTSGDYSGSAVITITYD